VLVEKSGNLKQVVNLMNSQTAVYFAAGNFRAAIALADRTLKVALREGSPANIGCVHALQVQMHFIAGDLAGAEEHFAAGFKYFDDPDLVRLPAYASAALGMASWNAWTLGRADVAREREARMMAVTRTNPYAGAWSAVYAGVLRARMREHDQAESLAAEALALAEQHQFPFVAAAARTTLGNARAQLGRVLEGVTLLRRGIAQLLEIEARLGISHFTTDLAAALERQGAIPEALATIEQALQLNPNEMFYRPETLRLRGELRLKQGQNENAEADFREAIALAQRMGAKAWELRATISLARLLASIGYRDEARAMLTEIYNWFTEGFDTRDLTDAKALLDQLSASIP
jgi:tetratricopeptide (TPR) repeat protein